MAKYLDFSKIHNIKRINNKNVKYFANSETLNLSNCRKITDEGVKYLTNVKNLDLSFCRNN